MLWNLPELPEQKPASFSSSDDIDETPGNDIKQIEMLVIN